MREEHATEERATEVNRIVAEAAELPLLDAAFSLWRRKTRLDTLEGRPTEDDVRRYRAMTPEQQGAYLRYKREHADEGPMFGYLKRAHPHASDADIRQAIIAAVRFDDDCCKYFNMDRDFWDCVMRAVAMAAKKHPDYLDTTYRDARNHIAYYMK